MPTISKSFTHTCAAQTNTTVYAYNYLKTATALTAYQEASQFFFEDLKNVLEQTGMDITFSEEYTYAAKTDCPYFEMFGLQFPVLVVVTQTGQSYYGVTPQVTRTGSAVLTSEFKYIGAYNDSYNMCGMNRQASLCTSYNDRLSLEYTINVVYNDNWIIASYSTHAGLKYPIFSLIKGKDINNKEVVYESANPNACFANRGASATSAYTYHHLVWTEDWYLHKYNGYYRIPNGDAYQTYSSYPNYNGNIFLKLSGPDTVAGITVPDNKIQLMEPICCGNRVFFDNMYVVPDTVNVDSYYTINNELYYCPGDYTVQMDIQYNAATMTTHACRFLLKMESQN